MIPVVGESEITLLTWRTKRTRCSPGLFWHDWRHHDDKAASRPMAPQAPRHHHSSHAVSVGRDQSDKGFACFADRWRLRVSICSTWYRKKKKLCQVSSWAGTQRQGLGIWSYEGRNPASRFSALPGRKLLSPRKLGKPDLDGLVMCCQKLFLVYCFERRCVCVFCLLASFSLLCSAFYWTTLCLFLVNVLLLSSGKWRFFSVLFRNQQLKKA